MDHHQGGYHNTLPSKTKTLLHELYGDTGTASDEKITGHLTTAATSTAPEFPADSEWVNSQPLTIHGSLSGRYVLLDFFTYCCINCMHILPALHQLEQEVTEGLVVVGVHSGKFSNEKNSDNILNAVARYKITHPVINDQNYEMWNNYSIICWPTLVLINPAGKVVLISIGESDVDKVCRFVKDSVRLAPPSNFDAVPLAPKSAEESVSKRVLSFPGKVYYHGDSNTLFISDSSNNRVIRTNCLGELLTCYRSTLDSPQGLLVHGDYLYVCDTNHHRVMRVKVDQVMEEWEVVCGTGHQGHDLEGGKQGIEQDISSPWDLELINLTNVPECEGELLIIAMAGTHQLWGYALTDVSIKHRGQVVHHELGKVWRLAGSGDEANKNNSYPHKASFAQPSGLSYDGGKFLYVADSESSTVRCVELPSFSVKNVAGGGLDPSDLFAYGDADGKGTAAKLQHPIGITVLDDQRLLVADSYNHKLKQIQTKSRIVTTCTNLDVFSEPSGLSYDKYTGRVYVADTNNHVIRAVHVTSGCQEEVRVVDKGARATRPTGVSWVSRQEDTTSLALSLHLAPDRKLNNSAPSKIQVTLFVDDKKEEEEVGVVDAMATVPVKGGAVELLFTLYSCSDDGACYMDKYLHRINLVQDSGLRELLNPTQPIPIYLE